MGSLESLNEGQRAVLQLLLGKGKSYDEIARLLHSDPGAVRRRAHGAVDALGPDSSEVPPDRRHEIADYLLGQQTASQRAATREYLEGSAAGRGWARSAASGLAPFADDDALPDIPAEREEVAEAFDALDRRTARQEEVQRSSQLGGRLIAAGLGVVLAIIIILVVSLTGGDDSGPSASTPTTSTTPTATSTTDTLGGNAQVFLGATLRPPQGSDSPSRGEVAIVLFPESKRYRLALAATKLPPSSRSGSAYGVWFYTSPKEAQFLGFPDKVVGRDGKLQTVADLPPNTPGYREVLLTSERTDAPSKPGTIILRGRLVPTQSRGQGTTPTQTTP
jgi:DNA-directed RNA polymerase specialized sigma24 family protein